MKIWDVGHSTLSEEDFISLLQKNRIEIVVDVRRFPSSRKFPHFEKNNLQKSLLEKKFFYLWMGDELGGFRKEGYEEWMKTEKFSRGLEKLEMVAKNKRTAFMCAEGDHKRCHRRFIASSLEKRGWEVNHISLIVKKKVKSG